MSDRQRRFNFDETKALNSPTNAKALSDLNDSLYFFKEVFSTFFPNNHIKEAYNISGNIDLLPDDVTMLRPRKFRYNKETIEGMGSSKLVPAKIPKGADRLLNPESVYRDYIKLIDNQLSIIEEARPFLDNKVIREVTCSWGIPYSNLYEIVQCERCVTNTVFFHSKNEDGCVCGMKNDKGKGEGWRYIYNPYKLAIRILNDFRAQIDDAYKLKSTKIEKITSMMIIAKAMLGNDTGNFDLLKHDLWITIGAPWPVSPEY